MRLLGQVTQTEPLLMVIDYMSNGNLRDLVYENRCVECG